MTTPQDKARDLAEKFGDKAQAVVTEMLSNPPVMAYVRGVTEDMYDEYWEAVRKELERVQG